MNISSILDHKLLDVGKFQLNIADLAITGLLLIITLLLLRAIKAFFNRRVKSGKIDKGSAYSIYSILRYLLWIVFILTTLETIGVNLNIMLAGSAALLVGLGFGIQQIFNDMVSGVIILIEGNLKVGDIIEFENEIVGKVSSIGLRTSKIQTRDDIAMIIPNSKFINDRVINWSHNQIPTRFMVEVGVAYGSDVEKVTQLLLECTRLVPEIEKHPAPFVRFADFGDSSLNFQILFWTLESFRSENTKSKLRYAINKSFTENNIQIPFPQRDVHIVRTV